jgi:hypothetical protein
MLKSSLIILGSVIVIFFFFLDFSSDNFSTVKEKSNRVDKPSQFTKLSR